MVLKRTQRPIAYRATALAAIAGTTVAWVRLDPSALERRRRAGTVRHLLVSRPARRARPQLDLRAVAP